MSNTEITNTTEEPKFVKTLDVSPKLLTELDSGRGNFLRSIARTEDETATVYSCNIQHLELTQSQVNETLSFLRQFGLNGASICSGFSGPPINFRKVSGLRNAIVEGLQTAVTSVFYGSTGQKRNSPGPLQRSL